jgi:hypothetical protein
VGKNDIEIQFAIALLAAAMDHGYNPMYVEHGHYLAKRFAGGDNTLATIKAVDPELKVPSSLQAPCFWSLRRHDGSLITNGAAKNPIEAFRSIEAARIADLEHRGENGSEFGALLGLQAG